MSEKQHLSVIIKYGEDIHMQATSETPIMSENIAPMSRFLMDGLYLRLDDQVTTAKLRAHRRRLRDKRRERAVGQVLITQEKGAGE